MTDASLLIVGAGPTGLTAAVELARRGIMARVVDRKTDPLPLSRAVGINARSMLLLEPSGVTGRLLDEGIQVRAARLHYGTDLAAEIWVDRLPIKYNFMLCLPQDRTEGILIERFQELGGCVEFGVSLENLEMADDGVSVCLRHGESGHDEEARFTRVLGADGARSAVRGGAGLPYEGRDLSEPWGVADVTSAAWPHNDKACAFLLPRGRAAVVIPIGVARYRIVGNQSNVLGLLPNLIVDSIRREAAFEIRIRQVGSYQQGPIFLAGDAAHCHSPVGGRGMNLGIDDAVSFARRLAENDLDGYTPERHDRGKATIRASERGRRAVMAQHPLRRLLTRLGLWFVNRTPSLQKRIARTVLDV